MRTSNLLPEECKDEIRQMIEEENVRFDDPLDDALQRGLLRGLERVLDD